jgi:preprotein translocase subunit SecY
LNDDKYATIKKKIFWTLIYLLIFVAGRNIPVPFLSGSITTGGALDSQLMGAANIATGGNFFSPSLFSLGLGPWMIAMILWRLSHIDLLLKKHKIPEITTKRIQAVLTVIFAVFQAVSLTSSYQIKPMAQGLFSGTMSAQILVTVVLVAGGLVVVGLAKLNEKNGLGGMTMLILYQIVFTTISNFSSLSGHSLTAQQNTMLTVIIIVSVFVVVLTIVLGTAELRLHVNKTGIDSGRTGLSYLPIKINPAGAAPIMYGLTLFSILQYIVYPFTLVFPAIKTSATNFLSYITLSNPVGFVIYLIILFCMSIFFGLITVNPKNLSEQMKNSGDYFDSVAPGVPTMRYLRKRVVLLSVFSGVLLVVFTGLPLYFIEVDQTFPFLAMLPGTVFMFVGLLLVVREELADLMIGTKYSSLFFD